MSRIHLITGATGFVGGAIALELLQRTDAVLHCLVRPRATGDDIQGRLETSLIQAARMYGLAHLQPQIPQRCTAIAGNIIEPCGGVDRVRAVDEVWHAAASLNFEDEKRAEIWSHNVDGTRHMLDFARAAGADVFNYVSTAYVAGKRQGLILEELETGTAHTNNWYEASKVTAEHLVATSGLYSRIFRPSVVIGHSRTLAATSLTGFYGVIRHLVKFQGKIAPRLGLDLRRQPLHLRIEPDTWANIIPVDRVARDAVSVSLASDAATTPAGRIYHLTNDSPPTMGLALRLLFQLLDLQPPRFVRHRTRMTAPERYLDDHLTFYTAYMRHSKVFSRQHTDACVQPESEAWRIDDAELVRHICWYLDVLGGPTRMVTPTSTAA